MDLKDVIATVDQEADEAHRAFHAGHNDNAEGHLMTVMLKICVYFDAKITLPEHVTEASDILGLEDKEKEKPVAVQGAAAQSAAVAPGQPARAVPFAQQQKKQTQ